MCRVSKEIIGKSLVMWGISAGSAATLIMSLVMFLGRVKLGTPLIPELIAQRLSAAVSPDTNYTAYMGGIAIHLVAGVVCGIPFLYLLLTVKIKNTTIFVVGYSVFLWLIFSAVVLPILGFGFFGKYLAGIPAIGEAALLSFYLLYGLTLYSFSPRPKGN